MKYEEFEKRVVDTFNRMHFVESCDEGFIEAGADADVGIILAESFKQRFHIKFTHNRGYYCNQKELMKLFEADLDGFLLEALDSYNDVMDKYHVAPMHSRPFSLKII
jgi:hypothetical protein